MEKIILKILFLVFMVLPLNNMYSQATPTQGSTASQLASQLAVNGGFTITTPVITNGLSTQRGLFSNGIAGAGLEIDTGILLTTGIVNTSILNQSSVQGDDFEQGGITYDDVDLVAINPLSNYDVVVYEFDFTIAGADPKIFALDYQFASEEYPDYVCANVNDIFGFFVSGGDLAGTSNLASVGGSNVAVNFVNSGVIGNLGDPGTNPCVLTNSSSFNINYGAFNDNGTPLDLTDDFYENGINYMMYNGFTTKLRAYTILRPGITYHMKMAIADTTDDLYDSGIFIAPIQLFDLPSKTDVDFDGIDDYVNTSGFMGGYTVSTMQAWLKLDTGFSSEGDVCGQYNNRIFVDAANRLSASITTGVPEVFPSLVTYNLDMYDDFGDGWSFGTLGTIAVKVNGIAILGSPFTVTGFYNGISFIATEGDLITVTLTADDYPEEMSFELYNVTDGVPELLFDYFDTGYGVAANASVVLPDITAVCTICPSPSPSTEITRTITGPVLSTEQWYHATSKYNGVTGDVTLYLNGDNVGTSASGLAANLHIAADAFNFSIGRNSKDKNSYFNGNIDEVKVYNLALSDTQIREQIYQEIENTSALVTGSSLHKAIDGGTISWNNLKLYYDMDLIYDITLIDNSSLVKNGFLNNITSVQPQTAPVPFVANATGVWGAEVSWQFGGVWDIETVANNKDWSIVQITNNATITTNDSHTNLGMIVDSGAKLVVSGDNSLTNTSYLKLDGVIDLVGESQLVQTINSDLDVTSSGELERDQQGMANKYRYNFWSSPVNPKNSATNNTDYSVSAILKDGTTPSTPKLINFISVGYDGAATDPITVADYWIYKYPNLPDNYNNWFLNHVRSTGAIRVGEGFSLKGSGVVAPNQNYVFVGKPNNADVTHSIDANNIYLIGNPYPSAIDAHEFIRDNNGDNGNASITGALYFWEHWGGDSHVLSVYQGGYATKNLTGFVFASPDPDVAQIGSGSIEPKQYIPIAQGFFVQGDSDGGNINFKNSQRTFVKEAGGASVFFKSVTPDKNTIKNNGIAKMRFKYTTTEGYQRQLLLGVKNNLPKGLNYGYDAPVLEKLPSDCLFIEEERLLVIQTVGEINNDLELPLEFIVDKAGKTKFEANSLEGLPHETAIFFIDKKLNTSIQLKESMPIELNLEAGVFKGRFYLSFSKIGVEEIGETKDEYIVMYDNVMNEVKIINERYFSINTVKIHNILGQQVHIYKKEYIDVNEVNYPIRSLSGMYFITFKPSEGKEITKKFIID